MKSVINTGNQAHVTVSLFDNQEVGYLQKSVIGRIQGTGTDEDVLVILGAHMDSAAFVNPITGVNEYPNGADFAARPAPGADDNASGVSVARITISILWRSTN